MKNEAKIKGAVDSLLQMYESGNLPEKIAWSIIRRRGDEPVIPSDSWSLGNLAIMYSQNCDDARGYKQWQQVGRSVKKGAKALYILGPCTRKIKEKDKLTGEEKERVIITGFRPIPVFNIEDTDGKPVPQVDYTPQKLPPLWSAAETLGIPVRYAPLYRNALGTFKLSGQKIELYAEDPGVYFHELGHAVHHCFVQDLRTVEPEIAEMTAEFSAMVLCQLTGDTGYVKQGFEYIQHYAHSNKPDSTMKLIMSVLSDTEKIVNIILDAANGIVPTKEKAPALEAV